MQEFIEKLITSWSDTRDECCQAYTGGKTPKWESIDNMNDLLVAIVQKFKCVNCRYCYWHHHCGEEYLKSEIERVLKEVYKKTPKIDTIVTCGVCVYATSTKPKICMCPDGIAKHAYVGDDCYCDKGELCTT